MARQVSKACNEIAIDPEFEGIIPPLSKGEEAMLEESILQDGCRHAIVVWKSNGTQVIVDGHNRHRIVTAHGLKYQVEVKEFRDRDEAKNWIIDNQMARRNLSRFSAVELQLKKSSRLKDMAKQNQRRSKGRGQKGCMKSEKIMAVHVDKEVGIASGVSPNTVRQVKFLIDHAATKVIEDLRSGNITINAAHRVTKRSLEQHKRKTQIVHDARVYAKDHPDEDYGILHGDFRTVAAGIADATVSLILIDPPYRKNGPAVYEDIGKIALRILKPGGNLLVYSGSARMAEAIIGIAPFLKYHWIFICRHQAGHEPPLRHFNVVNRWKPILWFLKGKRSTKSKFIPDLLEGKKQKHNHEWEQDLAEAEYLIEYLTQPGDTVADFFCGSGTTALAATMHGRRHLAVDCDIKAVLTARRRIGEYISHHISDPAK